MKVCEIVTILPSLAYDIKTLTSASAHDNGTTNESALDQPWANEGKSGPRSWSKIAGKRNRGLRLATLVPRTQHSGLLLAVFVGIVELIKLFLECFFFVECVKHLLFRSTKIVENVTAHPTGCYLRCRQKFDYRFA